MQEGLSTRGFRSLAISMRGAAGSDVTKADEDYAPVNFAKDLASAVDALSLDGFILVGHSLGASTVTNYMRDHADRVRGLVLMSGGALKPRRPMTDEQREAWRQNIQGYPGNINRDYWEAEHVGLPAETRRLLWEDWQRVPPQRMRGAQSVPVDLRPVVESMATPTLVIFGDRDRTVPPGGSAECYLALPARVRHLHVFHGVDHSPNAITPDRTAAVISRFVRDVVEHA
jgi:pimeloyl-ACP methyl ester carboxylesterase